MAGKEVANIIKLQIPGGKASPAPPVGPALGGSGAVSYTHLTLPTILRV